MIKLTFCLRRRADLSVEEFQRYWREVHAPLVAERAEVLGIRRYVQVHTSHQPGLHDAFRRRNDGAPDPFDGVAELWFDDLSAFGRDTPEARDASAELRADEANFIDLANSPMWVATEHPIVDRDGADAVSGVEGTRAFHSTFSDDLVASRDWYVELFDYDVVFDSDWFVQLHRIGSPQLEIGLIARHHEIIPEHHRQKPAGGLLTIVVDDADAVHARAVAAGADIVEEPRNLFYGQRRLLLRDPDGALVDVSSECEPDPDWLAGMGGETLG